MQLQINGENKDVADNISVDTLLDVLAAAKMRCAVEVNGVVVKKAERKDRILAHGDVVEIVTLVGGG